MAITVSEPIQTPTQPPSTTITNDQPSSSSFTIQTSQEPPPNLLKSEFLEAELLAVTAEVQRLVEHRRSPTLHLTYQEQWETLQTEGEKNHKKGGLNYVFGNFFFYVLDNCPQVQSLK